MTDAVAAALGVAGCPSGIADRLAQDLDLRPPSPPHPPDEWLVVLHGQGCGVTVPVERADWAAVAEHLARNLAADNAEAHDRASRGETGWTRLWPPPDRHPRRV